MTGTDEGTIFIANGGVQKHKFRLKIGDLTNYILSTSDFVIEFSLKTTSHQLLVANYRILIIRQVWKFPTTTKCLKMINRWFK